MALFIATGRNANQLKIVRLSPPNHAIPDGFVSNDYLSWFKLRHRSLLTLGGRRRDELVLHVVTRGTLEQASDLIPLDKKVKALSLRPCFAVFTHAPTITPLQVLWDDYTLPSVRWGLCGLMVAGGSTCLALFSRIFSTSPCQRFSSRPTSLS